MDPNFEGFIVNVNVMVVTKKGTHEVDVTKSHSFVDPGTFVQLELANQAQATLERALEESQKAGIL